MSATAADLPDDIATLKAMVLAGLEREARMQHILDQITVRPSANALKSSARISWRWGWMISTSLAPSWTDLPSNRRRREIERRNEAGRSRVLRAHLFQDTWFGWKK
jgi:hypothetical protein